MSTIDNINASAAAGQNVLPIFARVIEASQTSDALKGLVGAYQAEVNAMPETFDFVSIAQPTDVIVSRWFPGYRESDLSGKQADEAIGLQLASAMSKVDDLERFRRILATPSIASTVIERVLPRAGVPVKRGVYLMSERKLANTVAEVLQEKGETSASIVAAFTYIFVRVFSNLELIQPGSVQKVIMTAESYAVNVRDLRVVIMVDALRDVFSEARISAASRALNKDASPDVIGDTLGRMLRTISMAIPEIKVRMAQLQLVITLINMVHVAPDRLTDTMQANANLAQLASYANFTVFAAGRAFTEMPSEPVAEQREACQAILAAVQSAPSVEIISLKKYAESFGFVPGSAPEGLHRGAVVYMPLCQTSKMDIIDTFKVADGMEVQMVPKSYSPVTAIAAELNRTVLQSRTMEGVANLVADELGQQAVNLTDPPLLLALGVSAMDLQYIAMSRAVDVAFAREAGNSAPTLVYSAHVVEQWRQRVLASTSSTAYFSDPASLIAYSIADTAIEPRPLPSRPQSLSVSESTESVYRGDVSRFVTSAIEKRFGLKIPLRGFANSEAQQLTLQIRVLGALLGSDENGDMPDRGEVHYMAIREPGVDRDLELMLSTVCYYAESDDDILSDRAKSWLVEVLIGVINHPAVRTMAERSINKAIIEAKIDARALATQYREFVIRAAFGTAVAVLAQFEKIPNALAVRLKEAVPISNLTIKAQLGLASVQSSVSHAL